MDSLSKSSFILWWKNRGGGLRLSMAKSKDKPKAHQARETFTREQCKW